MKLVTVSPSTFDPVDLEDVKRHLRLETGETREDEYLRDLVKAAADRVEGMTNRALTKRTLKLYLNNWSTSDSFELPYAPLSTQVKATIQYRDADSSTITFASTAFSMDSASEPGRVCLGYNDDWPTVTLNNMNPISIQYQCGYPASSAIPSRLKQAVKIIVSDLYENRESVVIGQGVQTIRQHVKNLVRDYRNQTF